jgi:hypothetical protein
MTVFGSESNARTFDYPPPTSAACRSSWVTTSRIPVSDRFAFSRCYVAIDTPIFRSTSGSPSPRVLVEAHPRIGTEVISALPATKVTIMPG